MRTVDDSSGLTRMDNDECLRLLETVDVGRLAIVQGHAPAIFPVNYLLDGRDIVFRTAPGAKLTHGPRAPAAFEIDQIDPETRSGWSVVVLGRLEEVTRLDRDHDRLQGLPLQPWAGGERNVLMRLIPGAITGRVIG